MIKPKTVLEIKDNTGAKLAKCIQTLKDSNKDGASIGNIVVLAIKKTLSDKKIKKGQVKRGLIIESKRYTLRGNFEAYKSNNNSAILISYDNKQEIIPLGTRILAPVPRELKNKKLLKVISLSSLFI